jgi:aminopeptidase N
METVRRSRASARESGLRKIVLAVVAALAAGACAAAAPRSGRETASGDRASPLSQEMAAARAQRVRELSYALWFDLDPQRDDFEGRVVIGFVLDGDARGDLLVDFQGGAVEAVSVNGADFSAGKTAERYDGSRLRFESAELNLAGANSIEIAFTHPYSTTGNGLHRFVDPADSLVYLYSNFEPYNANRMFPCFDQPDLKASYELSVEVPDGWQVISSVREREVRSASGRATWSFGRSAIFSSYLFPLHAGPYASWTGTADGIPIRLFARQSLAPYVDHDEWLEVTRQGLAFFQAAFAYPYPYAKYDQILVPDFNSGAMENVAAVTFSERYVSRSEITRDQRRDRANTILHEMAHMWFGNLVTMRWWNGLWLNESFATWAAAWAVEDATDFRDGWLDFFAGMKRWAYWEDQLVTTHPIEAVVPDTDSAFANFDGITYGKGASVLQQLSFSLGERGFREGLQRYFQRFAFGNTDLEDFIGTLGEASGQDLEPWQQLWLESPGLNGVEVSWACAPDAGSGRSEITRLALRQSPSEFSGVLRPHRTRVGLYSTDTWRRIGEPITVSYSDAETSVAEAVGRPCPDFVYPNAGDYDFVKVSLDPASLDAILAHIARLDDAMLRLQLWHTLWEMVVDGKLAARDYAEAALAQIGSEKNTLVLAGVLGNLASAQLGRPSVLKYLPDPERELHRERMEAAFLRGLENAPEGSDLQLIWYFALLEVARSPQTLAQLGALLDGELEVAGLRIDRDRRWELIRALARGGAPGVSERIAHELAEDPTDSGHKAAIAAEASLPDADTKASWRARMEALEGPERLADAQLRQAMEAHHQLGQEELTRLSVDWYFAALPRLAATRDEDLAATFSSAMFPALCDAEVVQRIDALLASHASLPASVTKNLRVARQEEERCLRARGRRVAPAGAPAS